MNGWLRVKKVLRDISLEPVMRVALRELKDFAIPLNVKINGNSEVFWKFKRKLNLFYGVRI